MSCLVTTLRFVSNLSGTIRASHSRHFVRVALMSKGDQQLKSEREENGHAFQIDTSSPRRARVAGK